MAIVTSITAAAQVLGLTKGPGRGAPAPQSAANLRIISDKAVMPVGTILAASEYVRFGKVPKGAVIYANNSLLSTNHTATIPGKLQFVPLDGSAVQEITSVTANLEATETTSIPDAADDLIVAKESWAQFVPTADTTIAASAKNLWLRLSYGQTY